MPRSRSSGQLQKARELEVEGQRKKAARELPAQLLAKTEPVS